MLHSSSSWVSKLVGGWVGGFLPVVLLHISSQIMLGGPVEEDLGLPTAHIEVGVAERPPAFGDVSLLREVGGWVGGRLRR